MAVGVVAGDAAIEPEHLIDPEKIVEDLLKAFAADAGIALLHFTEQALFRREQDAVAIGVDGAAFKNDPMRRAVEFNRRLPLSQAEKFRCATRDLVIELPVVVLGPGIEAPIRDCKLTLLVPYKNRAGIAQPSAVGGPDMKADLIEIGSGAIQNACDTRFGLNVVKGEMHALVGRKQPDDLRVDPGDGLGTFPASLQDCGATRARLPRAAPILQACGSRVGAASGSLSPW